MHGQTITLGVLIRPSRSWVVAADDVADKEAYLAARCIMENIVDKSLHLRFGLPIGVHLNACNRRHPES